MSDTPPPGPHESPAPLHRGLRGWFSDRLLRRLFGNASWLMGGKSVNAVFGLAALAIGARALGVETFGVLILIHTFALAMGELAKFQSWQAVLRYGTPAVQAGEIGDFQRLIRFTVLLDAGSAVLGMALSVALVWLLTPHLGWGAEMAPAAMVYITSVLFMVTATPTGILRLVDRFDILGVHNALAPLVRMVGGAVAWALDGGIYSFLVVWYLGTAVSHGYLMIMAYRALKARGLLAGWRWRGGGLTRGFPGIWRFVWITNINTSLELVFGHMGTLAVGWLLGPAEAALFRIAKQFADAIAKPAQLLIPAIYPELSRLAVENDHGGMRQLMQRAALLAGGIATLTLGLVIVAGDLVLRLTVGAEFTAAHPVMVWLVAAAVVGIWSFPLEPLLISTGHPGSALKVRTVVTLLYIPLLLLLLDRVGLVGAGWAALAAALLIMAGLLLAVVRWFGARAPAG